jgi:CoA:oxalate CoA-transferase
MERPLQGVKVVDLTMFLAGPYGTRLLADMGAEVIKVEPPGGDFMRRSVPFHNGKSRQFAHLNCGKKSIELDLKKPGNVDQVLALAKDADVVVENFRPGVAARLGVGYEQMRAVKPDIIFCSVTGYGQTGPGALRPSFAPIVHASSGFDLAQMSFDPALEKPLTNRNTTADILASTHAFGAITAALFYRERSGKGQHIDVTMIDAMHNMMTYEFQAAQLDDPEPTSVFRPLAASDGYIMIAATSDANFAGLANVTGHPEWLQDERFTIVANRNRNLAELMAMVEAWTSQHSGEDCERLLREAGCPCTRYYDIATSMADEQTTARRAVVDVEQDGAHFLVPNCPFTFSDGEIRTAGWSPDLGQHNQEYLKE